MKIRDFLSENFQFLEEKFSIYLNRRVFVMPQTGLWAVKNLIILHMRPYLSGP